MAPASAAAAGLSMPPEWAPHERTLMAWPCRRSLWGGLLEQAKAEYAGVANAIAEFEPVTMVCADAQDAADARAALSGTIEIAEIPIDDSWLRDSGPVFVTGEGHRRAAVHFGFNAWGEKFQPYDRDAAVGGVLGETYADEVFRAPFVLEGGSITCDGSGAVITTEQCLLHPNRNPSMSREEIEAGLLEHLGAERVVWLGQGLVEDRDTDGHVDLICVPLSPKRVLLQAGRPGTHDHDTMAANAAKLVSEGFHVEDFPLLAHEELGGEEVMHSYLNLYVCNGAAIVPLAGGPDDHEALQRIDDAFGHGREIVGVPALAIAAGGGGPHCITQQVPAR